MKPNWVCANCGMWSTRKFSVKRHITNKHKGNAFLVRYIDYLVGRQSGLYPSSAQPEHNYKEKKSSWDVFNDEFWKEMARRTVNGNTDTQM